MLRRVTIAKHERGLVFKKSDYVRMLAPGSHWVLGFGRRVKLANVREPRFDDPDVDLVSRDPATAHDLTTVDLRQHERALVWVDDRLRFVQGPGRVSYWKVLGDVRVETIDARSVRFHHEHLQSVLELPGVRGALLDEYVVGPGCTGLLLVDEKVKEELGPGRYAVWRGVARARVEGIDQREQVIEAQGQELLSKDKVALRLNVVATYRVVAPRRWLEVASDARGALYRDLQLAVRAAVGGRTLDELLAAKEQVGLEVQQALVRKAEAAGAAILDVGVKDVILPGEVRALLNQVVEAERKAQANLITRREETAATRSLLNTARLYAENPALLRLKELETAERIAEKVKELRVSGIDELLARLLPNTASNAAPPARPSASP